MRRLLLLALMLLAVVPACAAAQANVVVGFGDQKPDMFSDPRFLALDITHTRLAIPWDVGWYPSEMRSLSRWMNEAHALGMDPLISFDHSLRPGHHKDLPTPARFGEAFHLFRSRYPWVREFATWNEANYCGEVTCHVPGLVASYYLVMRHACPRCTILAAEVLDVPGMAAWVRDFIRAAHMQPPLWGMHNYVGANRLSDASTRELLGLVRGDIWITEVAGVVARHNHSSVGFPQSPAHAATVTAYVFSHLIHLSPRIRRVYLYEWNAHTNHDNWDSALIAPNGRARPAYAVLARALVTLGVKPNCAISEAPPACA